MDAVGPLSDDGLVGLLTHTGERKEHDFFSPYAADLTPEDLRGFYRAMSLTRAFDHEAESLQRQGELGLWVQSLGQEGAQVGSGAVLRGADYAFPSYREHAVAFQRGVDLPQMLTIFRGLKHGAWDPADHNFHLYTLVIGAHTLHATGYAMGLDKDGLVASGNPANDAAVITYFGDGATAQGDVNEALVFASVYNAPIVFFCQNNQFAISEPTTRQAACRSRTAARASACQRCVWTATTSSRRTPSPTGRCSTHAPAPAPSSSRRSRTAWARTPRPTTPPATARRPTRRIGQSATPSLASSPTSRRSASCPKAFVDEVEQEGKALAVRTREEVRSWEPGPNVGMFDNVYAAPHANVETERAWYERFEASFVEAH